MTVFCLAKFIHGMYFSTFFLSLRRLARTGPIPTEIGHLTALNSLNLRRNRLTGRCEFVLTFFVFVVLTVVVVVVQIVCCSPHKLFANFGRQTRLFEVLKVETFSLFCATHTHITYPGRIPSELQQLQKLEFITLSSNKLTGGFTGSVSVDTTRHGNDPHSCKVVELQDNTRQHNLLRFSF